MEIDSQYEMEYVIQPKDLAKDISIDEQDDFPGVLATSRMVALMEIAAARLMKTCLSENEISVGVNIDVSHFAATPNNELVKVIAIYKGMKGKFYQFAVELFDKAGKAGSGKHSRAIVEKERLLQSAINRVKT